MKVVCASCAAEGKPALMGEKEPLDDPRETHGICAEHQRRLAWTLEEFFQQSPPCVREPASPDIEGKPIGPFPREGNDSVGTKASAGSPSSWPKPILYLCRGERTWLLSQDIAEEEGSRPYFTATQISRDVDGETALRIVQAELPDYDIRVMNWQRPKRDNTPET